MPNSMKVGCDDKTCLNVGLDTYIMNKVSLMRVFLKAQYLLSICSYSTKDNSLSSNSSQN